MSNGKSPSVIIGVSVFNSRNEVLLIRQPKWGGRFGLPGGHVEHGETLHEAAIREIKEETGLDISGLEFFTISESIGPADYAEKDRHFIFIDYRARKKQGQKVAISRESTEFAWRTVDAWTGKFRGDVQDTTLRTLDKLDSAPKGDYHAQYLRAVADYQNLLKDAGRERDSLIRHANRSLLMEILPVYEFLKLALEHARNGAGQGSSGAVEEGVAHVLKQFKDVLARNGITEIQPDSAAYDHTTMEAVSLEETGDPELDGRIARIIAAGYMHNGSVLIPARVVVYKSRNSTSQ